MKMKQPLSALRSAGKTDAPKKERAKRTVSMAARQVPLEIDVRGQLPEEAIDNVDKYLDDCMMAGLSAKSPSCTAKEPACCAARFLSICAATRTLRNSASAATARAKPA